MPDPSPPPFYGLYLIPPADLVEPLSGLHALLEREFGCIVAGRFMAHITVKGFFKPKPSADIDRLMRELDAVYAGRSGFQVAISAPQSLEGPRGCSAFLSLKSESLGELHRATWRAIEPYIAEDCPFSREERHGDNFYPHLTLAQYDLPADPVLKQRALDLCQHVYANLPRHVWQARDLQFIRFESQDWLDRWWETLRFRQLKGWALGD